MLSSLPHMANFHSSILAWRIPKDSGTWQAAVHGVAKSRTLLSDWAQCSICFTRGNACISMLVCQLVPPPFPTGSTSLFSVCVSTAALKYVHWHHFFQIPYISINIWCFFSVFDLLYSVWQDLGTAASLELTQICPILWLGNIPLCIRTTTSLSIHLLMDI